MRDGFWGLKRMGCGEGLIALLQRTGQPLNRKWAVCVCIEGAEWGMGRRPECTDFPCTIWGPRASCWTCLGHSLPICKTRAWSRPFCFKESISGLSELPRPRHIPVGEVCQAGLKQDRVSSPPTPWRLTRFSTSSSSFIPSSSSSVRDRKGLSVPKSRYSHLTGSPRSKTKS